MGHIAVQVLGELCATEIIAVDRSAAALELASTLGAHYAVNGSEVDAVEAVKDLTGGEGADAVIDFVGEGSAIAQAVGMLRKGGTYWVVGYGGQIEVPAIDMIFSEIAVVGSLVGNYNELAELMGPGRPGARDAARGRVLAGRHQRRHPRPRGRQRPGPRGDRPLAAGRGCRGRTAAAARHAQSSRSGLRSRTSIR